jgi:hypothetical protein
VLLVVVVVVGKEEGGKEVEEEEEEDRPHTSPETKAGKSGEESEKGEVPPSTSPLHCESPNPGELGYGGVGGDTPPNEFRVDSLARDSSPPLSLSTLTWPQDRERKSSRVLELGPVRATKANSAAARLPTLVDTLME